MRAATQALPLDCPVDLACAALFVPGRAMTVRMMPVASSVIRPLFFLHSRCCRPTKPNQPFGNKECCGSRESVREGSTTEDTESTEGERAAKHSYERQRTARRTASAPDPNRYRDRYRDRSFLLSISTISDSCGNAGLAAGLPGDRGVRCAERIGPDNDGKNAAGVGQRNRPPPPNERIFRKNERGAPL